MKKDYLLDLREGRDLPLPAQLKLIAQLSVPAILAEISTIVMEYIDASMVGRLGGSQAASIGLVSSSTWLFGGVCRGLTIGFTVLVAQSIGARDEKKARDIMKHGYLVSILVTLLGLIIAASISGILPVWLGGGEDIVKDASAYFLIFAIGLPIRVNNGLTGSLLQASGNMKTPGLLHVMCCFLDIICNCIFIFPGTDILGLHIPGFGLGVAGAALGTTAAETITLLCMLYSLLIKSPMLRLRKEKTEYSKDIFRRGIRISLPVCAENFIVTFAQLIYMKILAPLGTIAIAAHSFAITAESLCYMPGYGVNAAATTLVGQSVGAGRDKMTKRLSWLSVLTGMAVMTLSGLAMYIFAPAMIGILSPDPEIVALGSEVLRIEAWAEPLFAASIVCSGVFRGEGDTLVPTVLSMCTMWFIRIPAAALLAPRFGLHGVWVAMAAELSAKGIVFLIRLALKGHDRGEFHFRRRQA